MFHELLTNDDYVRSGSDGLYASNLESIWRPDNSRNTLSTVIHSEGSSGHAEPGDVLRKQKDSLILVEEGSIGLKILVPTGRELFLAEFKAGDVLIPVSYVNAGIFRGRYIAEGRLRFRSLPVSKLGDDDARQSALTKMVIRYQKTILADCFRALHELTFVPTAQRIYAELLRLEAQAQGCFFVLPSRQEFACRTATSRETVSRELTFLKREGVIKLAQHRALITQRSFLLSRICSALDLSSEDEALKCIGVA